MKRLIIVGCLVAAPALAQEQPSPVEAIIKEMGADAAWRAASLKAQLMSAQSDLAKAREEIARLNAELAKSKEGAKP